MPGITNYNNINNRTTNIRKTSSSSGASGASGTSGARGASNTSSAETYSEFLKKHQEWEKECSEIKKKYVENLAKLKKQAQEAHTANMNYQNSHGGRINPKLADIDHQAMLEYARFYNAGPSLPPEPKCTPHLDI